MPHFPPYLAGYTLSHLSGPPYIYLNVAFENNRSRDGKDPPVHIGYPAYCMDVLR